jgi:hypothetical protein
VGTDRLAGALIGNTGDRIDDRPALVAHRDLKPDLSPRGDTFVDRRLDLALQASAHPGNRHVVWLKLSPRPGCVHRARFMAPAR